MSSGPSDESKQKYMLRLLYKRYGWRGPSKKVANQNKKSVWEVWKSGRITLLLLFVAALFLFSLFYGGKNPEVHISNVVALGGKAWNTLRPFERKIVLWKVYVLFPEVLTLPKTSPRWGKVLAFLQAEGLPMYTNEPLLEEFSHRERFIRFIPILKALTYHMPENLFQSYWAVGLKKNTAPEARWAKWLYLARRAVSRSNLPAKKKSRLLKVLQEPERSAY